MCSLFHHSNFCTFEIVSLANVHRHYLLRYGSLIFENRYSIFLLAVKDFRGLIWNLSMIVAPSINKFFHITLGAIHKRSLLVGEGGPPQSRRIFRSQKFGKLMKIQNRYLVLSKALCGGLSLIHI